MREIIVHVGPSKTGTTAIQHFLRDNRVSLLQRGYLVPLSGMGPTGAHHPLARVLCGEEWRDNQHKEIAAAFKEEQCGRKVILSSEGLFPRLGYPEIADRFFANLKVLGLTPRLVLFPRPQPTWLNSVYAQRVKGFRAAMPFDSTLR